MVDRSASPVKCLKGLPTIYTIGYALRLAGRSWGYAGLGVFASLIVGYAIRTMIKKGFGSAHAMCETRDARDLAL